MKTSGCIGSSSGWSFG